MTAFTKNTNPPINSNSIKINWYMLNHLKQICFYGGGVGIDLSKLHEMKLKQTPMYITKELLQKYNIFEGDEETFYMKGISKRIFAMWPINSNTEWMYTYETQDESIQATSIIKTEDELITALKFSKLI